MLATMAMLVMILILLISMSIVIILVVVIITAAMVLSAQVVQTPGPADFVHQLVPLSVGCAIAT